MATNDPWHALGVEPIRVFCAVSHSHVPGQWIATSAHGGRSYTGHGPSKESALNWLKTILERELRRAVEFAIV